MIKKNLPIHTKSGFIEHIKQIIDMQILSFSEDTIDKILLEIHTFAKDKLYDEYNITTRLLSYVHDKKTYYYSKQNQSYNYDVLKYIIRWVCALVALGLFLYFIIVYYELPKEKELTDLIARLETFGINITRCSKRYMGYKNTSTHYYLEVSVNKDLSQLKVYDQYVIVRDLFKQVCQVHSDLYGSVKWLLIITGSCIFFVIKELFDHIRNFFRPNYKQRLETLVFIEQRLCQAQACLMQKMGDPFLSKVKRKKNENVKKRSEN